MAWQLSLFFMVAFLTGPLAFGDEATDHAPIYVSAGLRVDPSAKGTVARRYLSNVGLGLSLGSAGSVFRPTFGLVLERGFLRWEDENLVSMTTLDLAVSPRIGLRMRTGDQSFLELAGARSISLSGRYDSTPERRDVRNHRIDGSLTILDVAWNLSVCDRSFASIGAGVVQSSIEVSTERTVSDMVFLESTTKRHTFRVIQIGWNWSI